MKLHTYAIKQLTVMHKIYSGEDQEDERAAALTIGTQPGSSSAYRTFN